MATAMHNAARAEERGGYPGFAGMVLADLDSMKAARRGDGGM